MPTHDNFLLPIGQFGQIDGPDDGAIPRGAFVRTHGFDFRRKYPHTCYGRQQKTASEAVASQRVRAGVHWERPTGDTFNWIVCGGRLLQESTAGNHVYSVLRNTVSVDATNVTLTSSTVLTFTSRIAETIHAGTATATPGDYFYFDADGIAAAVQIATASTTVANLAGAYSGTATTGAFTIWRKITGTDVSLVPAQGRLWVFDGIRRPHWYGYNDGKTTGSDVYRECGVPEPSTPPTVTLANDAAGKLTQSSQYQYAIAYEDAMGIRSNAAFSHVVTTAAAAQKATLGSFPAAPDYVTRIRIYRSLASSGRPDTLYHIVQDIDELKLASSGTSLLVLATGSQALSADVHIGRYVKFATSGNSYRITDNSTTSITVATDASGETGTDLVSITGGFDYDTLAAGTWVDFCADADLDTDHEAPTHNTRPPLGLKWPRLFRGGGRFVAFQDGPANATKSQTLSYITGRPATAPVPTSEASGGENELDYWPSTHLYVGLQDGYEVKGFAEIGNALFALKSKGIWRLYQESDDIDFWFWVPVPGAEAVGCTCPRTIVERDKTVFFVGHDSQETDIIRFDGRSAFGLFRDVDPVVGVTRLRRTLESFTSYTDEAVATVFESRIYVSYPGTTSATVNDRTLRWDVRTQTGDIQPWGCGVFFNTYQSGDSHVLLCGAPTNVGHVYRILGTAADLGSGVPRDLITGEIGVDPDQEVRFVKVALEVRTDTGTDAATLQYSTDGLLHSDTSKSWVTMTGKAWPTTAGLHTVLRDFKDGPVSGSAMFRLSSTDAREWSILAWKILHDPREQKQRRK